MHWPSDEVEATIIASGVAIRLRNPSHPLLAAWATRGASLMRRLKPGAGRLKLATFLAQYHLWRGEFARCGLIVDAMPGLALHGVLPGEALVWLDAVANYARYTAQHQRAREAIDAALLLVREHGLRQRAYALHAYGASVALAAHDLTRAQTHVEAMRPLLESATQADQTHYWHYLAGLTLLRGDAPGAIELARTALHNSGEIGGPTRLATHALSLGQALLRAGDDSAALECFSSALETARQMDAALLSFTAWLMSSVCLLHLGRTADATQALHNAWSEGSRRDFRITAVWWLPDVVAEAAQAAIERGIETTYVRRFVRLHGLAGTDPALADWPWPLVLRSFGEFQAALGRAAADAPRRQDSATSARPAARAARARHHRRCRWPPRWTGCGPTPTRPRSASPSTWRCCGCGARSATRGCCVWKAASCRSMNAGAGATWLRCTGCCITSTRRMAASLERLQDLARRLLDLMRGPFLAAEDADWAAAARARYSRRFVLAASQLAALIEPLDTLAAIRLYERALDVEPLAESLSRRLIRLHAARGDRAEALRAWQACCTMLRVAGGTGAVARDPCPGCGTEPAGPRIQGARR